MDMRELSLSFEPPLARLRLARPERRNAMTLAMWRALPELCAEIERREDARVVVVEGAGGHFCAGADISEFDAVFRDAEAAREYLGAIEDSLEALIALAVPTIAALEGSSIGGGLALALCCDLRFCAENAHLAIPPAKLGLLYGPVETRRLVELVGPARAKDLLFSGRRVETEEALNIGLIDRRVPAGELRRRGRELGAGDRGAQSDLDPRGQAGGGSDCEGRRGRAARSRRGGGAGGGLSRGPGGVRGEAEAEIRVTRGTGRGRWRTAPIHSAEPPFSNS